MSDETTGPGDTPMTPEDCRKAAENRDWWRDWAQKQQDDSGRACRDVESLRQQNRSLRKRLARRACGDIEPEDVVDDSHRTRMARLHSNLSSRIREISNLAEALEKEQRIHRDDPASACRMLVDRIGRILDDIISQQSLIAEVIEQWDDTHSNDSIPLHTREEIKLLRRENKQMRGSIEVMGKDVSRLQFLSKGTENVPTVLTVDPSDLDIYDCLDKIGATNEDWDNASDGHKLEALRMLIDDAKKQAS